MKRVGAVPAPPYASETLPVMLSDPWFASAPPDEPVIPAPLQKAVPKLVMPAEARDFVPGPLITESDPGARISPPEPLTAPAVQLNPPLKFQSPGATVAPDKFRMELVSKAALPAVKVPAEISASPAGGR